MSGIDSSILDEFVQAVGDKAKSVQPPEKADPRPAQVVAKDVDGTIWVREIGGTTQTPVKLYSAEHAIGDLVQVQTSNGVSSILGNFTDPSASGSKVVETVERVVTVEKDLLADRARIGELEADNVTVNGKLTAAQADIGQLRAADATIDGKLTAHEASISSLQAKDAEFDTAIAKKLEATDLTAINADIKDLKAADVSVTGRLDAAEGKIGTLEANSATVEQLDAVNADISGKLTAAEGRIGTLESDHVSTTDLEAANAEITTLKTSKADVTALTAESARVDNLLAGYTKTEQLEAGYAKIDLANVDNAWLDKGVIKDAAISDAQIIGVSASKMTTGTLDASKVNVTNLNAKNINVEKINGVKVTGKSVADALAAAESEIDGVQSDVTALDSKLDSAVDTLNGRIDAQIETFTAKAVPTLNNYPASSWTTDKLKSEHVGDICYVVNAGNEADGYTYRFAYDETSKQYMWVLIKDNQVTAALKRLTEAEGDISGLQSFETETSKWIEETDQGLTTIRANHTSLSTKVDKTVKASTQLWHTKNGTAAPAAPKAKVTDTSTAGNAWRAVVPAYSASYPNYFYCWQYEYADGTFGWSAVVRDVAMEESQSTARTAASDASTAKSNASTAVSTANTAKSTADTAKSTADTAKTTADNAAKDASTAKTDASTAKTDAATAKSDASTAKTDAATAKSDASTAKTDAASAVSTANTAKTTAENAASDAADAKADASTAKTDAATAKSDASTAKSTASTAKSTADTAKSTADTAKSTADTAKSTADSKARNFTSQPKPPYSVGDTWTEGSAGDVKVCKTARASGNYTASDWVLASKYTDDTKANAAASAASAADTKATNAATAAATADGKAVSAQNTANANIKSSVMLWYTSDSATPPAKPYTDGSTSYISSTSTAAKAWTTVVPTYAAATPNYHYCYQQQRGDGKYQWTAPVYDQATSEAMKKAQAALPAATFEKFESTTFKEVVDEVNESSTTIANLTESVRYGGRNLWLGTGEDFLSGNPKAYSGGAHSVTTDDAYPGLEVLSFTPTTDSSAGVYGYQTRDRCSIDGFTAGEIYTISFDIKASAEGPKLRMQPIAEAQAVIDSIGENYPLTTEWQRVWCSFKVNSGREKQATCIYVLNGNGITVYATAFKLERGPFATPWEYAAEDVTSMSNTVNSVKQTATANSAKITSLETVNTKNGLTETTNIASRTSAIEQDLSGFKSTVSSTYAEKTTVAGIETEVNSLSGRVSTAESTITQQATSIEAKVSKDGVIAAINASVEKDGTSAARIAADKVNIEGAAIFTSGRLSSTSLSNAYDANGAASTALSDAKTYANTKKSEAISASASAQRAWYAECPTAAATVAKVATINPATTAFALTKGQRVAVSFTETNTGAVGSLTLNVNGTGAKGVRYLSNGALANLPAANYLRANQVVDFVYDGTYWVTDLSYNSDTTNRTRWQNVIKASAAITNGHIICGNSSGYRNIGIGVSFDMSYPLLYAGTALAAAATGDNNYLQINGINVTSNGSVTAAAQYATVYLMGTVSGNTFTITDVAKAAGGSNPFMTCTPPTSENGIFYIPLGIFYNSTTNIYFDSSKSLYAYIDGKFRQVTPTEIVASHRIYYRTGTANPSLAAPTAWVEEATGNVYNAWTTKVPPLAASTASGQTKYLYLYTCEQRKRLDGTTQCTKVLLDENTTVVDGANIITGSVSANQIAANAITADKLDATDINAKGKLTIGAMDTSTQEKINNGNAANSKFVAFRGVNSTAAGIAAKAVPCAGFALTQGYSITVYNTTANTSAGKLTLNVNSLGAKDVWVAGAVTSDMNRLYWAEGSTVTFVYDGTQFRVADNPPSLSGSTCSIAEGTAAKTTTANGCVIFKGAQIAVPMTNTNTAASPTLNVTSLGACSIYYGKTLTGPTKANGYAWPAGTSVIFVFDGKFWRNGNQTFVDGGNVVTGTIAADRIKANVISAVNNGTGTINADKVNVSQIKIGDLSGYSDAMTDAKKTATNYIAADSTGIKIANANPGSATTYQHQTASATEFYVSGALRSEVSGDGLEVYQGDKGSEKSYAKFGTTSRIGADLNARVGLYHGTNQRTETALNVISRGMILNTEGDSVYGTQGEEDINERFSVIDLREDGVCYIVEDILIDITTITSTSHHYLNSIESTYMCDVDSNSSVSDSYSFNLSVRSIEAGVTSPSYTESLDSSTDGFTINDSPTSSGYITVSLSDELLYNFKTSVLNSMSQYQKDSLSTGTYLVVFSMRYRSTSNRAFCINFGYDEQKEDLPHGVSSVALGGYAVASGSRSVAIGPIARAYGYDSVAYGSGIASGQYSTAIGNGKALGFASCALGFNAVATNSHSLALGHDTLSSGYCSQSQNEGTIARFDGQTAIGKYNESVDGALLIGNGTHYTARSNALTVDWNGSMKRRSANANTTRGYPRTSAASIISNLYYDSDNASIGYDEIRRDTSGKGVYRSYAVTGPNNVTNALYLRVKDDGTRVVSFSDASIWRSALGLGTLAQKSSVTFAVTDNSITSGKQTIAANGNLSITTTHSTPSGYVGTSTGIMTVNTNHNNLCVLNAFGSSYARVKSNSSSQMTDLTLTHSIRYAKVTVS